ncbi:hypothetical protein [Spiroplasma melliferum]|uniref:hypothetical protein n=1 Tax=Spiroplasma melliferum TaxID=2134 RepID=UPI000C78DEA4|nr:hypothetical protein [Spiroplasma melliferum]
MKELNKNNYENFIIKLLIPFFKTVLNLKSSGRLSMDPKLQFQFLCIKELVLKYFDSNKFDGETGLNHNGYNNQYPCSVSEFINIFEVSDTYYTFIANLKSREIEVFDKEYSQLIDLFDVFIGSRILSGYFIVEISLIESKKIEFNDSTELYNVLQQLEKSYNEKNFEYCFQLARELIRKTIYELLPSNGLAYDVKANFSDYCNNFLSGKPKLIKIINDLCLGINALRNVIAKGTDGDKTDPVTRKEWKSLSEKDQKLLTRLIIDYSKLIHNQFIVNKFENLEDISQESSEEISLDDLILWD